MNKKETEQRNGNILSELCRSLEIGAILCVTMCLSVVIYVEITSNPYEEYVPSIYLYDESYKTPGFLEFVEKSKNGTWKDLEQVKREIAVVEEVVEESEKTENHVSNEIETDNKKQTNSSEPRKKELSDVELLAQIIYAEEGVFLWKYNSNPAMAERVFKLAGSVIINRARSHYMGASTIHDVLYSKGQYDSRTKAKVEAGQEIPEIVYVWSQQLLSGGTIGPSNLVFQSESPQGVFYEQIGNQYFGLK